MLDRAKERFVSYSYYSNTDLLIYCFSLSPEAQSIKSLETSFIVIKTARFLQDVLVLNTSF